MRGILSILFRLPQYVRLSWRLLWDPSAPLLAKLLLVGAVVYAVYPFDLLPEGLIPQIGFGDDFLLLVLAIRYLIKSSPEKIVKKHAAEIAAGKPRTKRS